MTPMRIEIGPTSSASALMWLAYARTVLARIISAPAAFPVELTLTELDDFERFLNEWETIASSQVEFHWVAEEDADRVRALATTWIKIAEVLGAEERERGYALAHPDSLEFNDAVASGVLTAIATHEVAGGS